MLKSLLKKPEENDMDVVLEFGWYVVLIASLFGILSGILPAMQASKLNVVDALRS